MHRRRSICLVVGNNPYLATNVVWSLPSELVSGFLLVGGPALSELRRLSGCRGHLELDLDIEGADAVATWIKRHRDDPLLAIAADDSGCDFLNRSALEGVKTAPLATPETLRALRDKWAFFQLCERLELPTPRTELFADKAAIEIDAVIARLGCPLVVKPIQEEDGRGVVIVNSAADFRQRIADNPGYSFSPLLAQCFVDGRDLDVSLLARRGEVLHCAIQTRVGNEVQFLHHEALLALASKLIGETAYDGLAHIDARWRPDGGIELIECNTRPWGSLWTATWCGLNFVRAALASALGRGAAEPALMPPSSAPKISLLAILRRPESWLKFSSDQWRLIRGRTRDIAAFRLAAGQALVLNWLGQFAGGGGGGAGESGQSFNPEA